MIWAVIIEMVDTPVVKALGNIPDTLYLAELPSTISRQLE